MLALTDSCSAISRGLLADLQRQEAIDLVARAIRSGIFNDLGSGSNVDVSVIRKSGTEMLRNYEMPVRAFPNHLARSAWTAPG